MQTNKSIYFPCCLLQGRMELGGLSDRSTQHAHGTMAAYPRSDWSVSSAEAVNSAMATSSNTSAQHQTSYSTTVMSSPSLTSVHQSSFDDSESASLQECFDAATDLFMNQTGAGNSANDSVDGLPSMDVEDASELLTAAAAAVAAATISLPHFPDNYTATSFPSAAAFHLKEEMTSGQQSFLEMAAFQAAVQSVAALRQQPTPSSSNSPSDAVASNLGSSPRRIFPSAHGSIGRQEEASYRNRSYAPYPLSLPLTSQHQAVSNNFQTNTAASDSTSFAVPSTVIHRRH